MRKFILSGATLMLFSMIFYNCQKESFNDSKNYVPRIGGTQEFVETRLNYGQVFKDVISDPSSSRAIQELLGDDEIPLVALNESTALSQLVSKSSDATKLGITGLDAITEADPLLNLYVYYPNDEITDSPIERVIIANSDRESQDVSIIDKSGSVTIMGDEDGLDVVALVIKPSESLIAINSSSMRDYYGNSYEHLGVLFDRASSLYTTGSYDLYNKEEITDLENIAILIPPPGDGWDEDYYCANGIQDPWEEGVDCGGPFCVPCNTNPTCNDGVQNGWETGVDCGGPFCEPCEVYDGICGQLSDRDQNASEDYLHKFKLTDCATFKTIREFLLEGKYYEFRIDVIFADANGAVTNVKKSKSIHKDNIRKKKNGKCQYTKWYDFSPDLDIVYWNPDTYGDAMKYIWTEEDTGGKIKIKVFSIKTKFKIFGQEINIESGIDLEFTDKDDFLGESVVNYCNNTDGDGTFRTTGDVEFYVRQH